MMEQWCNMLLRRRAPRRALALTLTLYMVFSLLPVPVFGEETGACGHSHDETCRTREMVCGLEESENHVHTEACYEEVLNCQHVHDETCGGLKTQELKPPVIPPDAPGNEPTESPDARPKALSETNLLPPRNSGSTTVTVEGEQTVGPNKIVYVPTSNEGNTTELTVVVTAPSGLKYMDYYIGTTGDLVTLYDPFSEIDHTNYDAEAGTYTCTISCPVGEFFTVQCTDGNEEWQSLAYEIIWKDETSPIATFGMIEGTQGDDGWYTSNLKVCVNAEDPWLRAPDDPETIINESDASGIDKWEYSMDGVKWKTSYSDDRFAITANGEYTVRLRAKDKQGNVSAVAEQKIKLDQNTPVAPKVTAKTEQGKYTGAFTAKPITLTAEKGNNGNVSGVRLQYKLSTEEEWTDYEKPIVHSTNAATDDGDTYQFRAISGAGKVGTQITEVTVKYRALPEEVLTAGENAYGEQDLTIIPDPIRVGEPAEDWWTARPSVTVTPKEVIYMEGGGTIPVKTYYMIYSSPSTSGTKKSLTAENSWQIMMNLNGENTLEIWTEDEAGNETAHLKKILRVDTTPPARSFTVTGNPTAWTNADVTLAINGAYDSYSGLAAEPYSFDGGQTWQAENSKTYTANTTADAPVRVRVRDAVGFHTDYGEEIAIIYIDKTTPVLTWEPELASGKWYGKTTTTVTAEDDQDPLPALTLTRDGEEFDGVLSENGIYTVTAVGKDAAGNEKTETKIVQVELKIDELSEMAAKLNEESAYTEILAAKVWYDSQSEVIKSRFSRSDDARAAYEKLMSLLKDKAQAATDGVTDAIRSADTIDEIKQAVKDYDALPDDIKDKVSGDVKDELIRMKKDADTAQKVIEQLANANLDAERDAAGAVTKPGGSYEEKQAAQEAYDKLDPGPKALVDQVAAAMEDKESVIADLSAIDGVLDLLKDIRKPYTPDVKDLIADAENACKGLTDKQKDAFPNAERKQLDELETMRQHAQAAEDKIKSLSEPPAKDALNSAKGAYDSLTADEKSLVDGTLKTKLDKKYQNMLNEMTEDEKASAKFTAKVEGTKSAPTVEKIRQLIKDYDALSEAAVGELSEQTMRDYQKLVDDLNAAQLVIDKLAGINVDQLAPGDMDEVKEVLNDYENLTDDQKKLVDEAADGQAGILKEAVDTVKDAADQIDAIPDHSAGSTVTLPSGETAPDLDDCENTRNESPSGSTGGHGYENHKKAIEEAKIAYEKLTDAGRKLINDEAKKRLNNEYAALMAHLEYVNTAETANTNVEVAGLAGKVELPAESASAPKTVICVVMTESGPEIMPPTPAGKDEALRVDIKLVAKIYDDAAAADMPTAQEMVQPKAGERVLVKLKVPDGYRNDTLEIWHVKDNGGRSRIGDFWLVNETDGVYAVFEVSSFSHFVFFAEKTLTEGSGGAGAGAHLAPGPEVSDSDNGSASVDPQRARPGTTVTIHTKPDDGYAASQVIVTDQNGKKIPVKDNGNGTWSYVQPDGKATVTVTFKPAEARLSWNPFTDVKEGNWFYESVKYVYEKGLMNGTASDTFLPYSAASRGMIVTILWRQEGAPAGSGTALFSDVADDAYYSQAVNWAAEKNLIKGYGNGVFRPEAPVTRQELALILWQYARTKGYAVRSADSPKSFFDGADTASWAAEAMDWAVTNRIIVGKGQGYLDPTGTAPRAEIASMLQRFDRYFSEN